MNYRIAVQSGLKKKPYNTSLHLITGFTLIGIGALSILMSQSYWVQKVFHNPIVSGSLLGAVALIYGLVVLMIVFSSGQWIKHPPRNQRLRMLHLLVSCSFAVVYVLSQWWLAAAMCAVLAISAWMAIYVDKKMAQTLWVELSDDRIRLPATARRKQLHWSEVERVILRHGNITIDTVDNFLFQWALVTAQTEAEAIEAYCAARIHAHKDERKQDDW